MVHAEKDGKERLQSLRTMTLERPCRVSSQRLLNYMQTVATCGALYQRENAALRAQIHDLGELLAAFDLCGLDDAHLKRVRDRAFQRDIAPDAEQLEYFQVKGQLEQGALKRELTSECGNAKDVLGQVEKCKCATKRETESLQLRVEILERELANLDLRHHLSLITMQRPESSPSDRDESVASSLPNEAAAAAITLQTRTGKDGDN